VDWLVLVQSAVWVHDRLEMLQERGSVLGPGVQFPVCPQFNDVLHCHPHEVVCPDQTDQDSGHSRYTQPKAPGSEKHIYTQGHNYTLQNRIQQFSMN